MFSARTRVYLVTNTYHYFLILVENMGGEVEMEHDSLFYYFTVPPPRDN